MKSVLTIAGSDCSGGAGIQADIKTITAHKLYATSAITALTAQNTTGVYGVEPVLPQFLEKQLSCIFTDIFPDAVKIGMVVSAPLIEVIAVALKHYRPQNIVLDPVMLSTSGSRLLDEEAVEIWMKELMPLADIITPNIPEAEFLSGQKINNADDRIGAAEKITNRYAKAVLIKGGHDSHNADDLLYEGHKAHWFPAQRIQNKNTHGTGCTLSSAIACNLACNNNLCTSVEKAKIYITGAIKANLNLGKGNGPLNHMYEL